MHTKLRSGSAVARWALPAIAGALCGFAALGCARPPVTRNFISSAVLSHQASALDPKLLAAAMGEREGDAYRLGPGDTLLVAVYDHPELSIAPFVPMTGSGVGQRPVGLLIDNDGTIQLPLVGSVKVDGKTTEEVHILLERELGVYLKEPKVAVQLLFAGNIRYYLVGDFTSPGLKFTDRPLGLLEALSLGGSVDLQHASLRSAYVARKGAKLPIDFTRLVLDGDLTQNIRLKPGDVIVVPDQQYEQAFVFGGVAGSNPAGGAVPFVNGKLSLPQALARAGFGESERFRGMLTEVRVIRSEGANAEYFIVDAQAILDGTAASFELAPGDVVYVPPTRLADWDQTLNALLPFLETVGGVLQPFVQLKYLSGK
jgi:polysaccharide export outer membrane protein